MFSDSKVIVNQYGVQIGTILRIDRPIQIEFSNQPIPTKQCADCKQIFPLSQFDKTNRRKCKKCYSIYVTNLKHKNGRCKAFNENKNCTKYLGEHISEKLLISTFSNVRKAPTNNPGYDFVCGNGFKVDVKSSCLCTGKNSLRKEGRIRVWRFNIKCNTSADFFALIAFDSRESLIPQHYWMVPGKVLNKKLSIFIAETTLHKWKQYEKPIDKILLECTTMKSEE